MKFFTFENLMQVGLVFFTIGGLLLVSMKLPEYGIIFTFIAQFFWINASYKAWKGAGQIGIFINAIIYAVITFYGVINYWFLS